MVVIRWGSSPWQGKGGINASSTIKYHIIEQKNMISIEINTMEETELTKSINQTILALSVISIVTFLPKVDFPLYHMLIHGLQSINK